MSKIKPSQIWLVIAYAAVTVGSQVSNASDKQASQTSINETDVQNISMIVPKEQLIVLKEQAAIKIELFATKLQQALKEAINDGGLNDGIEACHSKAPEIASALSVDTWVIKRTSLRTRNTANKPDKWEKKILDQFESQFSTGEDISSLVASSYGKDGFRLIKAIPTGPICLGCHGSSVDTKTLEKINELYPNDTATGFSTSDLRGAFSVQKVVVD